MINTKCWSVGMRRLLGRPIRTLEDNIKTDLERLDVGKWNGFIK
jgi:hypothetical protein